MKRKYKILIIILVSTLFTFLIYRSFYSNKVRLVALGDGIASGETAYKIDGISYNDYIKDFFEDKRLLKSYNFSYAYKNHKLSDFLEELKSNRLNVTTNLYAKQILNKADIITINFGEEELSKYGVTDKITLEVIEDYIKDYDYLLSELKDITEARIYVIGFYENAYLTKQDVILLNSKLANIVKKNNYNFINVSDLLINKEYYLTNNTIYFNYRAHKNIAEMILNTV